MTPLTCIDLCLAETASILFNLVPDAGRLVVSDAHTLEACGWTLNTIPFVHASHHHFAQPPHADMETAEMLASLALSHQSIIALGSGTINDLCKYAAHLASIPYVIIATAPSMNGYAAPNASLRVDGYKQSVTASVPRAVLYDRDILAAAPSRLIASGIGDTLCRSTVVRDAWLSHCLLGTPFPAELFAEMQVLEQVLVTALYAGQKKQMVGALMNCLLHAGQAMSEMGNSMPASQGEHMIAHLLEMYDPTLAERHFHGEVIAVTTLTVATIYEESIALSPIFLPFPWEDLCKRFGAVIADQWQDVYEEKRVSSTSAPPPLLSHHLLSATELRNVLTMAGCPTTPADLGIHPEIYVAAVRLARFTRNRLTVLDCHKGFTIPS
jgi:glycerol-1-phosphate dehydrogenase [NAD(P)+]